METTHSAMTHPKKKLRLRLWVLIPVLLLLIALGVVLGMFLPKNARYNEAMGFLEKGRIREAVEIYGELGDYRNLLGEICRYTEDVCDSFLAEGAYSEIADLYDAVKEPAVLGRIVEKRLYREVLLCFENGNASGMTALYGGWNEESELKAVVEDAFVLYSRDIQASDPARFRRFYLSLADSAEGRALCGLFLRNTPALFSAHYEVDLAMLSYFTYLLYHNFAKTYEDYLSLFGLDPTVPLKGQEVSEGESWFVYFENSAVENLEFVLVYAEAAKAEAFSLPEETLEAIEASFAELRAAASESGMSTEAYLAELFGCGVSEADVRRGMELTALSAAYEKTAFEGLNEAEREAAYEALAARYPVRKNQEAISWLAE